MKRISMRAAVPVLLILQEVSCFSTQPAGSTFTCRSNGSNGRNNAPLLLRMSDQTTVERSTTTTKVSANEISQDLPADLYQQEQQLQRPAASSATDTVASATTANFDSGKEYRRGLATIGLITLVFASMSPVMHAALATPAEGGGTAAMAPPVLLLNAAVSVIALLGLVVGGPALQANTELPISLQLNQRQLMKQRKSDDGLDLAARAGLELGLWKFLGTTANLFGLALTTSAHGAFLVQLTTLIVPVAQGIMGVPIPKRIAFSIGLALMGVGLFTQDGISGDAVSNNIVLGDALCVVAACFYATFDLRLFKWGKLVPPKDLITSKIATQAALSVLLLLGVGFDEAQTFLLTNDFSQTGTTLGLLVLWSGLMVNGLVPFLQVGGQQAVGPTRAQTLYASQPLWAAIMSYLFLGEEIGPQGQLGGAIFLTALFLAATAEPPDPDCGVQNCEV